jgi:hypothetical protein
VNLSWNCNYSKQVTVLSLANSLRDFGVVQQSEHSLQAGQNNHIFLF